MSHHLMALITSQIILCWIDFPKHHIPVHTNYQFVKLYSWHDDDGIIDCKKLAVAVRATSANLTPRKKRTSLTLLFVVRSLFVYWDGSTVRSSFLSLVLLK
jgi:hypothetical protein